MSFEAFVFQSGEELEMARVIMTERYGYDKKTWFCGYQAYGEKYWRAEWGAWSKNSEAITLEETFLWLLETAKDAPNAEPLYARLAAHLEAQL